jgi:hypothetical protein
LDERVLDFHKLRLASRCSEEPSRQYSG